MLSIRTLSWLAMLLLLMTMLARPADGLLCYKCGGKDRKDCPGWDRNPVDTVADWGDTNNFYTDCVTIQLKDGTIVEQGAYPGNPSCRSAFIQSWEYQLNQEYNQEVTVRCCQNNNCNGRPEPLEKDAGTGRSASMAVVTLGCSLAVALYWMTAR